MKFAHMADCHIGGWAEPKMRALNIGAFARAVDICIEENVDFVLISGDLFNSSLPAMDPLKTTVHKLMELRKKSIPIYIIAGSHDFSPTGKTMIDVLCEAGLCINVVIGKVIEGKLNLRFTQDPVTGAKITGMIGRRGMLEKSYYESLDTKSLEQEPGYKIFMFHTAIDELKPKELEKMESSPISLLPKGFDYYAGGHVHIVRDIQLEGYKQVVYPGPLFPNNFRELEELGSGGFYIVKNDKIKYISITLRRRHNIIIDCSDMTVDNVRKELIENIENSDIKEKIILIRLKGKMSNGRQADIDFRSIFEMIYKRGAYFVMKNTSALNMTGLEEIKIKSGSAEEIEESLIKEHIGQISINGMDGPGEEQLAKSLLKSLDTDKKEGEKVHDFEERITSELDKFLQISGK